MKSKEEITKDYEKIINFVLKKMDLSYRHDELFDIGMIGFVNGINTFDESKGFQASTYLFECVRNAILKFLDYEKREKRYAEVISLNTLINGDTELIEFFGYEEPYEQNAFYDELVKRILIELNNGFTKRQEDIFKYIYGIDNYPVLTYEEIAKIFNTSRQSIYDTHKRILKKLKKRLLKEKQKNDKKN